MKRDHPLVKVVNEQFRRRLRRGSHEPRTNGTSAYRASRVHKACLLEAASVARGKISWWSDAPEDAQLPDFRPLNDALWDSDQQLTEHMLKLGVAMWGWPRWSKQKQRTWARRSTLRILKEVVADSMALHISGHKTKLERLRKSRSLVEFCSHAKPLLKQVEKDCDVKPDLVNRTVERIFYWAMDTYVSDDPISSVCVALSKCSELAPGQVVLIRGTEIFIQEAKW